MVLSLRFSKKALLKSESVISMFALLLPCCTRGYYAMQIFSPYFLKIHHHYSHHLNSKKMKQAHD